MKTRSVKIIGYIGFITILATIALFFILTEKRELIDWSSFCSILAVELILMLGLIILESKSGNRGVLLLRSGIYSVLGLYTFISIVVSILFMFTFREGTKYLIAIQIVLLAIVLITIVLIYFSSEHVGEANASTLNSISRMQELLNKVIILQSTYENDPISAKLNKLYEAIRYCDVSANVATDETIALKLSELQLILENGAVEQSETADKLIDNMLILMKQRATEMSSIKSGGI